MWISLNARKLKVVIINETTVTVVYFKIDISFLGFSRLKHAQLSSVRNIWVPKFEYNDDILNENMLCHLPTLYWSNRESCCQDNNILSIESLIFLHHFHYFDIIQIEGELYIFFCPLSSSSGLLNLGGKYVIVIEKQKLL